MSVDPGSVSDSLLQWLLKSEEPWVVLNTRVDLLDERKDSAEVRSAFGALQTHDSISAILHELSEWPQKRRLSRAYDPKDAPWKLAMLADFGMNKTDKRIASLAEKVMKAQSIDPDQSGFLHGGFDHTKAFDERPYICISHVMTYALARFGYLDDVRVKRAYDYLLGWQRLDGGWHPTDACLPGRQRAKDPSCPFGTVNVLRALGVHPSLSRDKVAARGVDFVLTCWERRSEPYRPIGFGMGSTFTKLQYPFVQHQLLKTIDTLSALPAALKDNRFMSMIMFANERRTPAEMVIPEGINKPFADFDFGQKKVPSPWMTFLLARANQRMSGHKSPEKRKRVNRGARISSRRSA